MNGYGGTPPGWPDPYGREQGWNDSGARRPGYSGSGATASGWTISALICNVLAVLLVCNVLAVPGIITAAVAIGRSSSHPDSARRLTTWSWSILVLAFLLPIAVIAVLLGLDAYHGDLDDPGF